MKISKISKHNNTQARTCLILGALAVCAAGIYMVSTGPSTPIITNSHKATKKNQLTVKKSKKLVEKAIRNFVDIPTLIDNFMKAADAQVPNMDAEVMYNILVKDLRRQLKNGFKKAAATEDFGDEDTYVKRFKSLLKNGSEEQIMETVKKFYGPVGVVASILEYRWLTGPLGSKREAKLRKKIHNMIKNISISSFGKDVKFKNEK